MHVLNKPARQSSLKMIIKLIKTNGKRNRRFLLSTTYISLSSFSAGDRVIY